MEVNKKRPFRTLGKKATEGNRTLDPPLTKRLLCQLSYGGVFETPLIIQGKSWKRKESLH